MSLERMCGQISYKASIGHELPPCRMMIDRCASPNQLAVEIAFESLVGLVGVA